MEERKVFDDSGRRYTLEKPECRFGYTSDQVRRILGDKLNIFNSWMYGRTMGVCKGTKYNDETKHSEPDGCGPHGLITYEYDLENFLFG